MDNPIQHINAKVVSAERQEADGMGSFLVLLSYSLIVNGSDVLCSTRRCLSFPLQENPRWRRAKLLAIKEARHELDRYFSGHEDEGEAQNIFADVFHPSSEPRLELSPAKEQSLQQELKLIEQEFWQVA
jgi:hypothetical protein